MDQRDTGAIFLGAWRSFASFIIPFIFDTAIGLAVFGAFLLFSWVLGLARVAGLARVGYLDAYENVHAWGNLGVYTGVGLSFLLRIIKRIFRGE